VSAPATINIESLLLLVIMGVAGIVAYAARRDRSPYK
jgi:hypothetical protein